MGSRRDHEATWTSPRPTEGPVAAAMTSFSMATIPMVTVREETILYLVGVETSMTRGSGGFQTVSTAAMAPGPETAPGVAVLSVAELRHDSCRRRDSRNSGFSPPWPGRS